MSEPVAIEEMSRPPTVFLFAHQDDEFAVFFAIEQAIREGSKVVCLYLTDGRFGGQDGERRNAESGGVLQRLGVAVADIHFLGTANGYPDGDLCSRLDDALGSVAAVLDPITAIRALYVPAWEGGHRDHDAVHLIGTAYALGTELLDAGRQFPLYRSAPGLLGFKLLSPLDANGPVQAATIPRSARLRYLRLCLCYPSQWKVWAALFPFLIVSYCTQSAQKSQPLAIARVDERPHPGPLLYERYGRASYETFRATTERFVRTKILRN